MAEFGTGGEADRMEDALEYLYGREYESRDLRPDRREVEPGSLDDSQPTLVGWLGEVRELFPRETAEVIERHALDRYGLVDLVTDPETLERLEPNEQLLKTLLSLKGHLGAEVLEVARRIIRQVVEELRRRLEMDVRRAMAGRLSQHRHSPIPIAANFDVVGTIRRNLKNYDPERQQIVLGDLRFFERNTRRLPWDVIICVDQSGSMVGSVIHSAVMAGILHGLPSFRVRLVVFDTNVVDLTDEVEDPVEVLMRVQLGGGTDIARARPLLPASSWRTPTAPSWCWSPTSARAARRATWSGRSRSWPRRGSRCSAWPRSTARPTRSTTEQMAQRLADRGMEIAALTPSQLAAWLVEVTS